MLKYIDLIITNKNKTNRIASILFERIHGHIPRSEGKIALSFPKYDDFGVGNTIRIFFEDEKQVDPLLQSLGGWKDVKVSPVRMAPENCGYVSFTRFRPSNLSLAKIRRMEKRAKEAGREFNAKEAKIKMLQQGTDMPFLNCRSKSTGQYFKLFIKKEHVAGPGPQEFNKYGLCESGTGVPFF